MSSPDYLRAAATCDEGDPWRSTLTPEGYAEWKVYNVELALDRQSTGWRDGTHQGDVEQAVFGEWYADDCVSLPAALRLGAEQYSDACIQLYLARPWFAAQAYFLAFGQVMSPEWKDKFSIFLAEHGGTVVSVIAREVGELPEMELRNRAKEVLLNVEKFYISYRNFRENINE